LLGGEYIVTVADVLWTALLSNGIRRGLICPFPRNQGTR